ncbi:hypothetical protein DL89DRAFT_265816, partial [Linderina pennispora]
MFDLSGRALSGLSHAAKSAFSRWAQQDRHMGMLEQPKRGIIKWQKKRSPPVRCDFL